jgi:transcriptional regulator with XRE-family HTH domain
MAWAGIDQGMELETFIGRAIARLRYQRKWTQDTLVAQLQCQGRNITRDMLAKIELGRIKVTIGSLIGFQEAFGVPLIQFFPKEIQDRDAHYSEETGPKSSKARSRHAQD